MKAFYFDNSLKYKDVLKPELKKGESIVKVNLTGVCRTDLELMKGYMGFKGVLGHECVGVVEDSEDNNLLGRRVVAEINAACGKCEMCKKGLGRHCYKRDVLGILDRPGCHAEFFSMKNENLISVPDSISNEQAVFTEPLSAAYEILEQLEIKKDMKCLVLGDGKLGVLCAWVLSTKSDDVTLKGRHSMKLEKAKWNNLKTVQELKKGQRYDVVVEATGSESGFSEAMRFIVPRGVIVLKSTYAGKPQLDLSPIVINEITLLGSRCGQFKDGLAFIEQYQPPLKRLIDSIHLSSSGIVVFSKAGEKGALKHLIQF